MNVNWLNHVSSVTRARYANERGICFEHLAVVDGCTTCAARRDPSKFRRRIYKPLYRFEVENPDSIPIMFFALGMNSDEKKEEHREYYPNGRGVFDRSGIITGIIEGRKRQIIEYAHHEIVIIKVEQVAAVLNFRKRFIYQLLRAFKPEDNVHRAFSRIEGFGYPLLNSGVTISSELRMYYGFVPLVDDLDPIIKISCPIQVDRGGSKQAGTGKTISPLVTDRSDGPWRFPVNMQQLLGFVQEARTSFLNSRTLNSYVPRTADRRVVQERSMATMPKSSIAAAMNDEDQSDEQQQQQGTSMITEYVSSFDPLSLLNRSIVGPSEDPDFMDSDHGQQTTQGFEDVLEAPDKSEPKNSNFISMDYSTDDNFDDINTSGPDELPDDLEAITSSISHK